MLTEGVATPGLMMHIYMITCNARTVAEQPPISKKHADVVPPDMHCFHRSYLLQYCERLQGRVLVQHMQHWRGELASHRV